MVRVAGKIKLGLRDCGTGVMGINCVAGGSAQLDRKKLDAGQICAG